MPGLAQLPLPSVLTQELRTPFPGRCSDLMGGTTTSWSTNGAAKVGEGQIETAPGQGCPKGQGLAGTSKGSSILKVLGSVVWREAWERGGKGAPLRIYLCPYPSYPRLSAAAPGPSQLCRWCVPALERTPPAQPQKP